MTPEQAGPGTWRLADGHEISTDKSRLDRALIHRVLADSYWARGRSRRIVDRCIENSLNFGLYGSGSRSDAGQPAVSQVGYARIVTDYATFAWLADVFVVQPERGRGLGKALLAAVVAHPDLQGLKRWLLATRDAHGLYADYGFRAMTADEAARFMLRDARADRAMDE